MFEEVFCDKCRYYDPMYDKEPCGRCKHGMAMVDQRYATAPDLFEPWNFIKVDRDKPERHAMICDEIKELYRKKNADYGDSFHKTFIEEGMAMPRIRLTDKLERFKRLTKSNEQNVKDENIRDTLIDLANYAIMTILELEGVPDTED